MDFASLIPVISAAVTALLTVGLGQYGLARLQKSQAKQGIAPEQVQLDKVRAELVEMLQGQINGLRTDASDLLVQIKDLQDTLTHARGRLKELETENRTLKDDYYQATRRKPPVHENGNGA